MTEIGIALATTLVAAGVFLAGIGARPANLAAAANPGTKSSTSNKGSQGTNSPAQTAQAQSVTSAFTMGWAHNFLFTTAGGSPTDAGTDAVAVDAAGNTIIAFNAYGVGNLDPAQSAAGAYQNTQSNHKGGFAKYDPSGNFLWMLPLLCTGSVGTSGTTVSYARGVAAGPASGDVYVAGDFQGSCSFPTKGGTTLTVGTSTTPRTSFVARVEAATGHVVWMDTSSITSGNQTCIFFSAVCDAAENVYACGYILGNCVSTSIPFTVRERPACRWSWIIRPTTQPSGAS
jgi:hypothetical protein